MNDLHTDDLLYLLKQEYRKNFDLRLSMKDRKHFTLDHWLASLGVWMVARGEKLQARYAGTLRTNQSDSLKPKPKKAPHNMYYTI